MKRGALLFSLSMLLMLAVTAQAAVDVTCFSSEFVRGSGEPFTDVRTVPGISGPATIKLCNGGAADSTTERVSSSEVRINGVLIFGPSNFNQNVSYLTATVPLKEGDNTLQVLLKSKPGGKISVQIVQTMDEPTAREFTRTVVLQNAARDIEVGKIDSALNAFVEGVRDRNRFVFQSLDIEGLRYLATVLRSAEVLERKGDLAIMNVRIFSYEDNDYVNSNLVMIYRDSTWKIVSF